MTKLKGNTKAKARKKKRTQSKAKVSSYKRGMASQILQYDNASLAMKCEAVPHGSDVKATISKMKKVLGCTANGVGLAASQVGILERVIVIKPDSRKFATIAMINPEIISHSDEKKYGIEGCLSYPKTFAPVERYTWVEVKYFDENWKEQTVKYREGQIEGIITQHEIEHLDEGHCQIYGWWKDMEGKQKELQEVFENKSVKEDSKVVLSNSDVVESEDLKREKAEAVASAE